MSDKIAHLKSEFKLDEDEAKISATLGSLFAKLSPEAQLAFVQKMSAQIQTPQNNVEEVAQEIGA
jgi:aspartate/tyrosine/aromatic aminotransferase